MRIVNKKYLLIILLVGIILTGVIVFKPKDNIKLDNVILKQEIDNKTFAMYIKNDDAYEVYEGNNFPNEYVLNINKSKCVDKDGIEIENALYTKDNKVGVRSNKSFYCYLYFDKSLGLEIKDKSPNGLKIDKERGAMYRFQGQQNDNIENYICFGTSDKDTCLKDIDHYMYRIIGIEAETGRVKVIKKEALENTYQWYTDYVTDIKLPDSIFFKAINGEAFLENADYVLEGWEEKISNNTWTYGDMWENSDIGAKQFGAGLYETEFGKKISGWYEKSKLEEEKPDIIKQEVTWEENNTYPKGTILYYKVISEIWSNKVDSKISLMYLNDYSYSLGDDAKCNYYDEEINYSKCKLGWIHLSQNDTSAPDASEWTMSRSGWGPSHGAIGGYSIKETGCVDYLILTDSISIRPVFYIDSSQTLKGGLGTLEDPFIIQE